jgi:ribosome-binding factor A
MSAERMRRVDEAMREVLSDAITLSLKDPRIGFVTVTAVETSPDLRRARVFVSVLSDASPVTSGGAGGGSPAKERKLTMAGLVSARAFLQKHVARELRLKNTPTLDFQYDDTAERAQRLNKMLEEGGE